MSITIRRRSSEPVPDGMALPDSLHPLLQRLYWSRGIRTPEDLELNVKGLVDWHSLKDIDRAKSVIANAVVEGQRILIVGDFDVDGATSSALALLALRAMGAASVDYLVPNRFGFGYGLTPGLVDIARQRSPDLLITVDNGISSIDGVAAAVDAGMKVVITDHHLPGDEIPAADAIVNPNQSGCSFPCKSTAGVGVIFYVICAVRQALIERSWSFPHNSPPKLADFLDLVALGTVADVVPLESNNRILVHQGIKRIRAGCSRPGILALIDMAGKPLSLLSATDLAFALAPRLNAAGRLDDMSKGIELLITDDCDRARQLATELDALNRERRDIEGHMKDEAMALMARLQLNRSSLPSGLALFHEQWHQGVIGILAARIKEHYYRPTVVFAPGANGEIKGSARSIPGLHLRDALGVVAARHPGLIVKFGGHAMAAGLTLRQEDFPRFAKLFDQTVQEILKPEQLEAVLVTDGELQADHISLDTAELIRESGPWGQGFPEPLFDGLFLIEQQRLVGGKHLKMVVVPCSGNAPEEIGHGSIEAICFSVDLQMWPQPQVDRVRLVYRLAVNHYRGRRTVQLIGDHIEPA